MTQEAVTKMSMSNSFSYEYKRVSADYLPEVYQVLQRFLRSVRRDYPMDIPAPVSVQIDQRSFLRRLLDRLPFLGKGEQEKSVADYFWQIDRQDNTQYLEAIIISSENVIEVLTPQQSVAVIMHEIGHDMLHPAPETGQLDIGVVAKSWYVQHRKARECQADHFAARYTSAEQTIQGLKGATEYGLYRQIYERLVEPLNTSHPLTRERLNALRSYDEKALAVRSERILFNDDCTIADIMSPLPEAASKPSHRGKPR